MAKRKRKKRRPRPPASPGEGAEPGDPAAEPSAVAVDDARRTTAARGKAEPGPPPAPWGSFPLSEIVVLIALVLLVAGFFVPPPRGAIMLGAGLVLGSLAGLELSVREHFSGYRSHTLLLAGSIGVAALAATLTLTKINPWICVGAAVAAFAAAACLFAGAFRRHSGGSLFRFKA